MNTLSCVVIDDEPFALDLIRSYVEKTPFLNLEGAFSNPFKALHFLNGSKVDLVFLDIEMPELSGLELYRSLVSPPRVIFTTAFARFAAESYDYNAVDYLLKPVKYERFLRAVNKATGQISSPAISTAVSKPQEEEYFFIKSGTSQVKLFTADVLYVEAAGNYMCFHTPERKIMSLLKMGDVLELLPASKFVRIHKSWIINLDHLESIDRHDVMIMGIRIPVGVTYREHYYRVVAGLK